MTQEQIVRQIIDLNQKFEGMAIPEKPIDVISPYLDLPGLVGFWPMSSVQRSTGDAYDESGQNRTLSYNGNPTYNIYNNLIPYIHFDGTGDYLDRADETDLDIQGNETIYDSSVRGLTVGGWFRFDATGSTEICISKFGTGTTGPFVLQKLAGDTARFLISDGAANDSVGSTSSLSAIQWYFLVGRFQPSTEIKVWLNIETDTNIVGIPATIQNSAEPLIIGARNSGATELMTGDALLCFLCANALPDAIIDSLFQQTRAVFGI